MCSPLAASQLRRVEGAVVWKKPHSPFGAFWPLSLPHSALFREVGLKDRMTPSNHMTRPNPASSERLAREGVDGEERAFYMLDDF